MIPAYIMTPSSVTLVLDGVQYTVDDSHPNFNQVREAIKLKKWQDLPDLVNVVRAVTQWSNGSISVIDGEVFFGDRTVHNVVVDRILSAMAEGFDPSFLARFLNNLMLNPSRTAVEELYLFLEHNEIPITEDGCFLAYKRVQENFTDIWSGKFDNSPGKQVSIPRNEVDDRRDNTCSKGLHFCAKRYLPSYASGRRVVVVKVNPADVVSIPSDYDNAKGRTWRYHVIAEDTTREGGDLKQFAKSQPRDAKGRFASYADDYEASYQQYLHDTYGD